MNKLFGWVLIFSVVLLTGFTKPTRIFFSAHPITPDTIGSCTDTFLKKQRIYYAVYVPKGFGDDFIRVQIVKKDEKSEFWGYKIYYCRDVEVLPGKKFYYDYINLNESGVYVMQVMEFKNMDKPIARGLFGVAE